MLASFQRAVAVTATALLLSCGSSNEDDAPKTAPTGMAVAAGDTSVVVTWDMEPGLTYWIFSAVAPEINRDNFNNFAGARITQPATSPQLISGLVNGTTYSFLINATRSGSAAGPATASIAATPRLAGSTWTAGPALAGDINALGTGGGKSLAVGAAGALYTRGTGLNDVWVAGSTGATANLNGLAVGGTIVAVGDAGTILTSVDTTAWTAQTSGTTARLNAALFAQLAYVAVGDNGSIVRSADGATWTTIASGTTSNLHGIALLGTAMLAVGANGTMLSSTDAGLTWTPVNSGTTSTLRAAATGNGRFVVVGDGGTILTSTTTDLSTWTAATSPTTADLRSIVFGSQLVVVGAGGTALVSPDGLAWTPVTTGTTADLRAVARGATLNYLAAGTGGVNLESR